MFRFILFAFSIFGLFLTNSSIGRPVLKSGANLIATQTGSMIEKSANEELRHLVEISDLIITGQIVEQRRIVDPEKMKKELKAYGERNLPNVRNYVKGYVYHIDPVKVIYKKHVNVARKVLVYSYGDPFSLHSNVVRFVTARNYLIFLSSAKETDIVNGLKISDPKNMLNLDRIDYKKMFIVIGQTRGLRPLDDERDIVKVVEKLVKEIKR